MAVQGDTCLFSALQTSSLNSCYVWIKRTGSGSLAAPTRSVTLNCVPCQLQTHRTAEEVTGLTLISLVLSLAPSLSFPPLFRLLYRTFYFSATYAMHSSQEKRQNDVQKTRARATAAQFLNAAIKHEACLVRLPWHPVSKSLPCLCEAEKQMSWVWLPPLDWAVRICLWRTQEDSAEGKNQLFEVCLVSESVISFIMTNIPSVLKTNNTRYIHWTVPYNSGWSYLHSCSISNNRTVKDNSQDCLSGSRHKCDGSKGGILVTCYNEWMHSAASCLFSVKWMKAKVMYYATKPQP